MLLAIRRLMACATASTERSQSNSFNRMDFRLCTHSGEPAILPPHNNRGIKLALALAAPVLLLGGVLAFGQGAVDSPPVFSSETRIVALNVTVTDKNGHPVADLPKSAFQ